MVYINNGSVQARNFARRLGCGCLRDACKVEINSFCALVARHRTRITALICGSSSIFIPFRYRRSPRYILASTILPHLKCSRVATELLIYGLWLFDKTASPNIWTIWHYGSSSDGKINFTSCMYYRQCMKNEGCIECPDNIDL